MTIINLRTADGFTLHNNYYAIPDGMPLEDAAEIARSVAENVALWEHLDAELAERGIEPVPNVSGVPAMTIDIDF